LRAESSSNLLVVSMQSLTCAVTLRKPRYAPPVENFWVRHCHCTVT